MGVGSLANGTSDSHALRASGRATRTLFTLWSGPIFGAMGPAAVGMIVRKKSMWFIANFCILANGMYIATAWLSGDQYLDTPKLLEHGAHPVSIVLYCLVTIGVGYVRFRRDCIGVLSCDPQKRALP